MKCKFKKFYANKKPMKKRSAKYSSQNKNKIYHHKNMIRS